MARSEIRRLVEELYGSKRSPFFLHEESFVWVGDEVDPVATLWFVEADYVPRREHVEETKLFAFESAAIVTLVTTDTAEASDVLSSPLQGFPGEKTSREGAATGFRQLARRARQKLFVTRTDCLLQTAAAVLDGDFDALPGIDRLDVGADLRMIFRMSELNGRLLEGFSDYLEREVIDAAVGVDLSQPDLSDDYIYARVKDEMKGIPEDDVGFVCQSDSRVVKDLEVGERTALFWRHGSEESRQEGGTWAAGSCYARIHRDFGSVRLDVVARTEELVERTDQAVGILNGATKIALGTETLSKMLGGQVPVPDFLFRALRDLEAYESRSSLRTFYMNHGQTFP